jgi:hypothetical protein
MRWIPTLLLVILGLAVSFMARAMPTDPLAIDRADLTDEQDQEMHTQNVEQAAKAFLTAIQQECIQSKPDIKAKIDAINSIRKRLGHDLVVKDPSAMAFASLVINYKVLCVDKLVAEKVTFNQSAQRFLSHPSILQFMQKTENEVSQLKSSWRCQRKKEVAKCSTTILEKGTVVQRLRELSQTKD